MIDICTHIQQIMLSKFAYDGELNPNWAEGPFKFVISEIDAYSNAKTPKYVRALSLDRWIDRLICGLDPPVDQLIDLTDFPPSQHPPKQKQLRLHLLRGRRPRHAPRP